MSNWFYNKKHHKRILDLENSKAINKYRLFIDGQEIKSSPAKMQLALRGDDKFFTLTQLRDLFQIASGKRLLSYKFFWDCSKTLEKRFMKYKHNPHTSRKEFNQFVHIKIMPVLNRTDRKARTTKEIESNRKSYEHNTRRRIEQQKRYERSLQANYKSDLQRVKDNFKRELLSTRKSIKKYDLILNSVQSYIDQSFDSETLQNLDN
jgi:hypothetical protein